MTITPEKALALIDNAMIQVQGTRHDHQVLEAAVMRLQSVVKEWKELKAKAPGADAPTLFPANGEEKLKV
jgi:hypothetical protein